MTDVYYILKKQQFGRYTVGEYTPCKEDILTHVEWYFDFEPSGREIGNPCVQIELETIKGDKGLHLEDSKFKFMRKVKHDEMLKKFLHSLNRCSSFAFGYMQNGNIVFTIGIKE